MVVCKQILYGCIGWAIRFSVLRQGELAGVRVPDYGTLTRGSCGSKCGSDTKKSQSNSTHTCRKTEAQRRAWHSKSHHIIPIITSSPLPLPRPYHHHPRLASVGSASCSEQPQTRSTKLSVCIPHVTIANIFYSEGNR